MHYTTPQIVHTSQPQGSSLCWAASVLMTMVVKRNNPRQTADWTVQTVGSCLGFSQDTGAYDYMTKTALEHYGAKSVTIHNGYPSWSVVKQEIDANRPIIINIVWKGGGGHSMVIGGWEEEAGRQDFNWVSLNDPLEPAAKRIFFAKLTEGNYDIQGRRGEGNPVATHLTFV